MSVVYAESSAVLRWLLNGADGARVHSALASAAEVVSSALTNLEVSRALHRLSAVEKISTDDWAAILSTHAAAMRHWKIHAISRAVLQRASDAFPIEPVRSLDAIHLATAVLYSREVGPIKMLSTDVRVRENAQSLGLPVIP